MTKYISILRIRFIMGMQYRAAALGGIVTQFAWGLMELLIFSAFYRENPAAYPMEFSQTVSYIWLQQAFLALFFVWFYENDIFASITSGQIAYELARPMDLYNKWFCQTASGRLAKTVLRCMPILLIAFIVPKPYRLSLPPSLPQFGLFLISMSLGLCVVLSVCMLVYISAFYTLSSYGVRIIAAVLSDFLAGAIIPLPFFPDGFRQIAELLPFGSMQNMPLRIYSGNIAGIDALRGILIQVFWVVILVAAGKILMKKALTRVIVQGG